ncbi:cytochrome P450 [Thalassovita aquimarina]|uniref:Cytochrome P450 n=1 Tax=Thalassovita aquimarina TaxID=2785917 RepID=A0ABS5HSR9_9RHOB|nr:cytochrome P450 [Thalassovita aquimarina]MBR9652030.1 cytochrome P450 [Thalassovita aquimarina]
MQEFSQSPTDPDFVQSPYPFYDRARADGGLFFWTEYEMPCAGSHDLVMALFKDRRFGRECPPECAPDIPGRLRPFYDIEAHSMLELEPPRHTRLRSLVLRAFTSRRIAALAPEIETLCHRLIDDLPAGGCDLLPHYATRVPVIVICRLLGVPEDMADQLLAWSNAMVAMYQARRTREIEAAAVTASLEFRDFITGYIDTRRQSPADDLISQLIAAEQDGEKLSTDELITTCILLLNAGHEATVHSIGNAVKTLLETGTDRAFLAPDKVDRTVEECLRFDPPLHMFTRYAYEDIEVSGHTFRRGDQVALLLGAANRDPAVWPDPNRFDPSRDIVTNAAFGGGLHFCVGAPLARLELKIALPALLGRLPDLALTEAPRYGDVYHFHGLEALKVTY